ncbi:hypothetical protein pipiens_019397 [Culex pipiens pipiens]|uniref:Uncharacterized protein n=1 Tax=Culex pipiens pipiens TaxID=38569 RepID=A0ABD1DYJ8_CULPP
MLQTTAGPSLTMLRANRTKLWTNQTTLRVNRTKLWTNQTMLRVNWTLLKVNQMKLLEIQNLWKKLIKPKQMKVQVKKK